jgi:hypothetical protein
VAKISRIEVQSQPRQIVCERHYLKNTQHKKRAGRVAQLVECLPSRHEALEPQKKKKKKKKKSTARKERKENHLFSFLPQNF